MANRFKSLLIDIAAIVRAKPEIDCLQGSLVFSVSTNDYADSDQMFKFVTSTIDQLMAKHHLHWEGSEQQIRPHDKAWNKTYTITEDDKSYKLSVTTAMYSYDYCRSHTVITSTIEVRYVNDFVLS